MATRFSTPTKGIRSKCRAMNDVTCSYGKCDLLLLRYDLVVVLVAGRTPHQDLRRTVLREVPHAVSGDGLGTLRIVVLIVDDSAAVSRAPGRVEVEPHRPEDSDHGLR